MATTLTPPELDLSRSDAELRPLCLTALSSLTPVLSLVNHGCEAKLRTLSLAMQQSIKQQQQQQQQQRATSSDGDELEPYAQQAHEFAEHAALAPAATEVRSCLRAVCQRVLAIADPALDEPLLRQCGLDVQGRLCLREYPKLPSADEAGRSLPEAAERAPAEAPASARTSLQAPPPPPPPPRLGAHCDSTLMTLLWADAPGLQVLEPARAEALGWRPQHVLGLGLPMMAPLAADSDDAGGSEEDGAAAPAEPPPLTDEQWAYVALDWARDPLLLTIGASWLTSDLVRERCPARCAALHRVVLPSGSHARHSLPFLADLVPREDEFVSPS